MSIGVRDDEAAEHEEEVHEQITVPDQREIVQMPSGVIMEQCDEDGTKPSPTVERLITQLSLRRAPKTMPLKRGRKLEKAAETVRPSLDPEVQGGDPASLRWPRYAMIGAS